MKDTAGGPFGVTSPWAHRAASGLLTRDEPECFVVKAQYTHGSDTDFRRQVDMLSRMLLVLDIMQNPSAPHRIDDLPS